jgi:hypothetical protein
MPRLRKKKMTLFHKHQWSELTKCTALFPKSNTPEPLVMAGLKKECKTCGVLMFISNIPGWKIVELWREDKGHVSDDEHRFSIWQKPGTPRRYKQPLSVMSLQA